MAGTNGSMTNGMAPGLAASAARRLRRCSSRDDATMFHRARATLRALARACGPGTDGVRRAGDLSAEVSNMDVDELRQAMRSLATDVERSVRSSRS